MAVDPRGKRIGIVGGGVGGLMAAWELSRLGFQVDLHEAASELGGLASAFDFDGFRIERFYHFICRHDSTLIDTCPRIGIDERLKWRETRTGFFYDGRLYRFGSPIDLLRFRPLSLVDKARFGLNVLYSRRFRTWSKLEDLPAKQWLIDQLGARTYSVIWDPLLRVKFDEYHEEISAAWMWHRIHRVATSRKSVFARERFGYLEGGSDLLIQTLATRAREAGATIRMQSRTEGLWTENGICRGLRVGGENVPYDSVICAVPLPVYRKLIPSDDPAYTARLETIRFIGVVCMILRLKQAISPNFWLNVHDPRISFNGIIEYSNLNADPRLEGRSVVYVPYYLEASRPRYSFPDEQLFDEYAAALQVLNPAFRREWVEGYRVFRAPHAQPICHRNFSEVVPPVETPWKNCYMLESTQLYPADRVISGTLRLAQDAVLRLLDDYGAAEHSGIRRRGAEEIPE